MFAKIKTIVKDRMIFIEFLTSKPLKYTMNDSILIVQKNRIIHQSEKG